MLFRQQLYRDTISGIEADFDLLVRQIYESKPEMK